jgi:biopolymer transport protein ExbD
VFRLTLWNFLPKASQMKRMTMAAIITNDNNKKRKAGFARSKRLSVRLDMTPMVDLGFLLITFFIFTTTMSQPKSMSLIMPKDTGTATPIKESGALTIIPTEKGNFYYYEGFFKPAHVQVCTLKEVRNIVLNKMSRTPGQDFSVVLKPTEAASYGNVVDLLDEMTIANVKRYALAVISPEEKTYLEYL